MADGDDDEDGPVLADDDCERGDGKHPGPSLTDSASARALCGGSAERREESNGDDAEELKGLISARGTLADGNVTGDDDNDADGSDVAEDKTGKPASDGGSTDKTKPTILEELVMVVMEDKCDEDDGDDEDDEADE